MERVRAVIIKDKKLLTIKRIKPDVTYWVIPGGAMEEGESKEQALIREAKEELGVDVEVKELLFEMPSQKLETIGQNEYFYYCEIITGQVGTGQGPEFEHDTHYVGKYDPEWIDIKEINNFDLRPEEIKEIIYNKYK